jgi:hypothetical protein
MIVEQQMKVIQKEDSLIEAISRNQPEKAEKIHTEFLKQIESSIETINKGEDFHGEKEFRQASLDLFKAYKIVAETEYASMLKISKIPDGIYTKEDDDSLISISKIVDEKLNKELGKFAKAQKLFADKYKIELTRSIK